MKEFLNKLEHDQIVSAIREAEKGTSGEIRVFISRKKIAEPVSAAQKEFEKLGMTRTRHRNGVLIFLAPRVSKFAVIGDSGVHERCGDAFWQALAAEMSGHFKKGDFSGGIVHAIRAAGKLLAEHFPPEPRSGNELPDEIGED